MNYARFGLHRWPFRHTPDTDAYYPASSHEHALSRLEQLIQQDGGMGVVLGPPGIGKSILSRRLLENLEENIRPVLLTNSHFENRAALLKAILFDLGLPYEGKLEQDARLAVTENCLNAFREGGKTLIVVDEAQNLDPDILEELRLLGNLEGRDGKAIQVILLALPEFHETLRSPKLSAFRQRLTVQVTLEPMSLEESVDYLAHLVRCAGGNPDHFFGEDVLDILSSAGNGNPRVLNQVSSLALNLSDENGSDFIDAEAAIEAVTQLGLDPHTDQDNLIIPRVPTAIEREMRLSEEEEEGIESDSQFGPTAEKEMRPLPPKTIPFSVPSASIVDEGPQTFVYGDDVSNSPEQIGPHRTWQSPTDRVG